MICLICTNINIHGQTLIHHETCGTFKNSVDLGCYICNRLWAALTLDERRVISALAKSEMNLRSNATEVSTYAEQTTSKQDCITTASSLEGGMYGHPGCYMLSLFFNASAVFSQKMVSGPYCRATILLRPLDGKPKSDCISLPDPTLICSLKEQS
jgi:hypothetical protein